MLPAGLNARSWCEPRGLFNSTARFAHVKGALRADRAGIVAVVTQHPPSGAPDVLIRSYAPVLRF